MKKVLVILLLMVLTVSLIGCGQSPENGNQNSPSTEADNAPSTEADNAPQDVYELKLASMYAPEMPETIALYEFEKILEEKSDGRIQIEIFPNCQLGPEEVYTDSLIQGVVDMAIPGNTMAKHLPTIAIGECPYLFDDWDHAKSVLQGPIGEEVFEGLIEKIGVRSFGFTPMGFSIIASIDEPITSYEDLQGRRFRVPPHAHFIEFATAIGTNPVPNMLTEFYSSMEQGVADSCIVPCSILQSTKVYELTPYVVETNDILFMHAWYINENSYQNLPEDLQQILNESVKEAQDYLWDLALEKGEQDKEFLISEGVTFNEIDDEFKTKLRELCKPLYDWYDEEFPGTGALIEKILNEE